MVARSTVITIIIRRALTTAFSIFLRKTSIKTFLRELDEQTGSAYPTILSLVPSSLLDSEEIAVWTAQYEPL